MRESRESHNEIYLDVETLKLSNEVPGGWKNIRDFGLAVAVTWDETHEFRNWFEGDAEELVRELEKFSRIITFNGERFDFHVLSGYSSVEKLHRRSLDLLSQLNRQLGYRVRLDSLAADTLGHRKSGSGLDAVRWWRSGEQAKVCEYCRRDVQLLVDLVAFARRERHIMIGAQRIAVDWR